MNVPSRAWIIVAALLGATAVALGAVGAHAVSDPMAVTSLERASTYQLIHAVVLLALSGMSLKLIGLARILMLVGVIGFSGAIYAKYLLGMPALGKFAPFGGTALILSWLILVAAAVVDRSDDIKGNS